MSSYNLINPPLRKHTATILGCYNQAPSSFEDVNLLQILQQAFPLIKLPISFSLVLIKHNKGGSHHKVTKTYNINYSILGSLTLHGFGFPYLIVTCPMLHKYVAREHKPGPLL